MSRSSQVFFTALALSVMGMLLLSSAVQARGRLGDRLAQRRATQSTPASVPANVRVWRDQAYGSDPRQRYDVYAPIGAATAPTLFMVHGGGWRSGDKAMRSVVEAKVRHWTARGYVVVSTNYRMLPDADPLVQARDVAGAIASAQRSSARWGADPERFVLMGHSAGAHLVALIAASPTLLADAHARAVTGAVLLDSAGLDIERLMATPHMRLYDEAFGSDRAFWKAASPSARLSEQGAPLLAVCSAQRRESCAQAHAFAAKAQRSGRRAQVLEEDLDHRQINTELGEANAYTAAVDGFVRTL
jgi:arylformamidase